MIISGIQRLLRIQAVAVLLLTGACATIQPPQHAHLRSEDAGVRECASLFRDMDARIDGAGVRDAEDWRVPGFPYLRSNRYLASLQDRVGGDPRKLEGWIGAMRTLDAHARGLELRNLPAGHPESDGARVNRCGELLMRRDLADPQAVELLRERTQVPDAYREWQRVAGLYALTRIPFGSGVADWHAEAKGLFAHARRGESAGHEVLHYGPDVLPAYSRQEVAALYSRATAAPFGSSLLSDLEQRRLLATYAPVFEVENTGDFDRPGALKWGTAPHPQVDTALPVVYYRIAQTRYRGHTLLQLVYTLWFSERPPDHAADLLAGKLDGLVWRVTLAPDGEVLLFDTMHPCGCFHMFLPTPAAEALAAPDPGEEWAFIPADMPRIPPGGRVRLRIATRSHYLLDAGVLAAETGNLHPYELVSEDGLRSLPLPQGGFRSAYGPDGLISGTERAERFFFWPMGIPSAGAMRQWGNHATAFLGKRHFDDADLLERRFRLDID